MERVARNWIYVLGADRDLVGDVMERLNGRSWSVFRPARDAPRSDPEEAHRIGARGAVAVVVLATRELYRSPFHCELLDLADARRVARKIVVSVDPAIDPFEGNSPHRWRVSARVAFVRSRQQMVDRIDRQLQRTLGNVSYGRRKPQGRRGVNVFVSYGAKDKRLRCLLCDSLEAMGMRVWDYEASPREGDRNYRDEIDDAIRSARSVLLLHTAAWDNRDECIRECAVAREADVDRVWLCFGRTKDPPRRRAGEKVIDLRAHRRAEGIGELERLLFPTRRKLRVQP